MISHITMKCCFLIAHVVKLIQYNDKLNLNDNLYKETIKQNKGNMI